MRIRVRVVAGSSQEKVECIDGQYKVWVHARAVDGKANDSVLRLLRDYFSCDVRLVSGFTSRTKLVDVLTD